MEGVVRKGGKIFFLLVLCVAMAATAAVCPVTTAWAAGTSAEESRQEPGSEGQPEDGAQPEDEAESEDEAQPEDEEEPGDGALPTWDGVGKIEVAASVRLTKSGKAAYISWKRVTGASAYKVQRSSEKNSGFKSIAALAEDERSYRDRSVEAGKRYYYRVAAKLSDGRTCYSEAVQLDCPLAGVSGVKLIRYSTTSIKVTWDKSKDKNAQYYKVYYATSESGKYKLAATTANDWYRVKSLKNNQNYYFQVVACVSKKASDLDSEASKPVMMRTMSYQRTTIFAGDSIMTGFSTYGYLSKIAIGGNKKVVAAIGLNTTTFRTKRVFSGKSATEAIIANKPYRVYIMLGDNDIHYRNKKDVIDGYQEILKTIKAGSPDTDIVVLAASPVTAATKNQRPGFAQIPAYNQDLKALAEKMGVRFYDCTGFMKDASGWLKSAYAAGDGIHWKSSVYGEYAKLLTAYDKSLD